MEYSNVVIHLLSCRAAKPSSHTAHHHSSSSLSFTNTIMGSSLFSQDHSSKQSLLQKGASKVRQIANSVKNSTPSKPVVSSTEPPKRALLFSLNLASTTLRIQITSSSFVSYIIHSLQMEFSQKALFLTIQKHELEVSKSTLSFTDRILTSPALPEVSLLSVSPIPPRPPPKSGPIWALFRLIRRPFRWREKRPIRKRVQLRSCQRKPCWAVPVYPCRRNRRKWLSRWDS